MSINTSPVDKVISLGKQLLKEVRVQRETLATLQASRVEAREGSRSPDSAELMQVEAHLRVLEHALQNCRETLDRCELWTGIRGEDLPNAPRVATPSASIVKKATVYTSTPGAKLQWFKVSHGFIEHSVGCSSNERFAINMEFDRLWLNAGARVREKVDRSTTPWTYSKKRKHLKQARLDIESMALSLAELENEIDRQRQIRDRLFADGQEVAAKQEQAKEDMRVALAKRVSDTRVASDEAIQKVLFEMYDAMENLPPVACPWESPKWADWPIECGESRVLLGNNVTVNGGHLGEHSDLGIGLEIPVLRDPLKGLHIVSTGNRDVANALARSTVLRALASRKPGTLKLTIFDPVGMGQSAQSLLELAEYDKDLIGGKIWSSTEDMRIQLASQSAHIEMVTQKYLRSEFASLEEFNLAAGPAAEPHRLLVLFDCPSNLDTYAFDELMKIIRNGPRCGVGVLLVSEQDTQTPHGKSMDQVEAPIVKAGRISPDGGSLNIKFDPDSDTKADPQRIRCLIRTIGNDVRSSEEYSIGFANSLTSLNPNVSGSDPDSWWQESSVEEISAPIGQVGARDLAKLTFDSTNHSGALLVGRPGSGKSTLMHAYLAGITTLYPPEELELHLIDFKEGVEFKGYAATSLPHAVSIAIESDRDFGLSVLKTIQAEIARRGNLLRDTEGVHSSLPTLREKTGEKLPRILLVFDEFQVLFTKNDKVGDAAAEALESIIRQGRGFGVHVLLASQSLSGLDALGSHVLQLLPVRILLPASEADSLRVLAEGNKDWQLLSKAGEGILNTSGGIVEANQPFRGIILSEEERHLHIRSLREKADRSGFTRRPIVFEGNAPIPADNVSPEQFIREVTNVSPHSEILRFGAPMTITGTSDVILRREGGSNVMLLARDPTVALGSTSDEFSLPRAVTVNSIGAAIAGGMRVEVIDFMAIDQGLDSPLQEYVTRGLISISRRRQAPDLLTEIVDEVRDRVDTDDTTAPPILLVLYGLHRAMDFDREAMDFDDDIDLPGKLEYVLMNGPEVGIHVFGWCESLSGLVRRLPGSALREFSWRLASQMSVDDSHSFVGSESAHGLRPQQLLLTNEDLGVAQKVTAYDAPSDSWISDLLSALS